MVRIKYIAAIVSLFISVSVSTHRYIRFNLKNWTNTIEVRKHVASDIPECEKGLHGKRQNTLSL
jgi:hypothetical protein